MKTRAFLVMVPAIILGAMAARAFINPIYQPNKISASTFSSQGIRSPTVQYTFAGAGAVSLETAFGGSIKNAAGFDPVAVVISIGLFDARIAFGGTTASQVMGHRLAKDNMYRFAGPDLPLISMANAGIAQNARLTITLEY